MSGIPSNQLKQEGGEKVQERREVIVNFANARLSVTEGFLAKVRELAVERDWSNQSRDVQRYIEIRIRVKDDTLGRLELE